MSERQHPLDKAMEAVEEARVKRVRVWEETNGDYYSEAYQKAQRVYDEALKRYNDLVRDPFSGQHK